jgi:serine/threonine protein kinase
MNTEPIANRCPKCQAPLPADAPRGLCPKCLLAAVSTPTEAGQPADRKTPPPIEAVAAAFPQLEIIELIGHGGMGVVYKARQPRLDRLVALKLLPQSLAADAAFAERFNREARVLARLNHPNIVTVHDFGQSGGFFYLLMEFVDGVNLRQAMQAGRFTPQQAMMLVPKICEALQFAHDEGILHRDIKPENILLDMRGRVKIADFGIAKLIGEAKENLTLTASGLAVGTPHYMAPEQLEHPQDVDQRADIYSLGVVFYEMLTGELPIGRFAPPSQKASVDARVDEVVFHALEKEREKRFRSADEVKTSVEAITSHPATGPAQPAPTQPSPGPAVPRHRAPCYFNTPERMRDCFPSAAARIFTCKGELQLDGENLTFISSWRTTITIPFKDIQDLSVGQFQMWTTPWVMKYARINFLSVTFTKEGLQQTILLTPVTHGLASAGAINDYVGKWLELVRQAVIARTGTAPPCSEPERLTVRAERAWGRKGWPLFFLFMICWFVLGFVLPSITSLHVPQPVWTLMAVLTGLLLAATCFSAVGFMRADRALKRGDLDAVTSDDPPSDPTGLVSQNHRPRCPVWWTVCAWAFVASGLLAVIDALAGLYSRPMAPTFSPGLAHLFAGIALLTLSRRWRIIALATLALALVAGALIIIMLAISPEQGSISVPALNLTVPAAAKPRWAAGGAVFMALVLGLPCYLLMSAKAKALFGLTKPK